MPVQHPEDGRKAHPPGTRLLAKRLTAMLGSGAQDGSVEILDRSSEPCRSTFPVEVVTFRVGNQAPRRLFVKQTRPGRCPLPAWHVSHGSRHGPGYEGQVYRHVLEPLQMTTPRMWGASEGPGDRAWLALEYVEEAIPVKSAPGMLVDAAAWIGRFHGRNETRWSDPELRFLKIFGPDYYAGWARRTLAYAERFRRDCREVERVCRAFEEATGALLESGLTVIHGEYYPANVLWRAGVVYPVDWESAAIAAGEIDLAALTEGWSPDDSERCDAAYFDARWPEGGDRAAFDRRLAVARLYLLLRWAGAPRAWKTAESRAYYMERLGTEARI